MIVDKIYEIIREINAAGHHDPAGRAERQLRARRLTRGYVLETGTVALSDDSESLRNDERVQAAYLGA